ncbi:MAG: bifunctional phosphopantothenoylcysteine decarboxylase/phosphopantothenate--cysteine ligase CoaBC [Rhodothermales bacterium]|nr:bifunctional phosphopantothenoylcysteine decarboxylase/phosphopantothenate--cysteine ligase CoaBC [Rhodothermales bacterium]
MSLPLPLTGRKLLLGVCGSIAAYKAAELLRLLKTSGADVQPIMTPGATRFISPLTLGTLSGRDVPIEIFPDTPAMGWTRHVELGLWADLFIIAPATADTLAKLAHGRCDSMLTATALSARCPILVCPAMDHDMFLHPATRANLATLASYGYQIMPPEHGPLASGLIGQGRLPEPEHILERVVLAFGASPNPALVGRRVLVTAGPTREAIDPVRFISNRSTGTMGYALAAAAAAAGAEVTLISGPTSLTPPAGVTTHFTESAAEMAEAVFTYADADIVIMAAAVADYTPAERSETKVKKQDGDLTLVFKRTTDILASLGARKRAGQVLVGFALETDQGEAHAKDKLHRKNLDWIVLNDMTEPGAGFGTQTNRVTMLARDGRREDLPLMSKPEVAAAILARIL